VTDILTPAEVAARFGVAVKTVGKWADAGKLASFRTPGGHRRFHEADVLSALAQTTTRTTDEQGA
jgi:excisionase family DNA binding protein